MTRFVSITLVLAAAAVGLFAQEPADPQVRIGFVYSDGNLPGTLRGLQGHPGGAPGSCGPGQPDFPHRVDVR